MVCALTSSKCVVMQEVKDKREHPDLIQDRVASCRVGPMMIGGLDDEQRERGQ